MSASYRRSPLHYLCLLSLVSLCCGFHVQHLPYYGAGQVLAATEEEVPHGNKPSRDIPRENMPGENVPGGDTQMSMPLPLLLPQTLQAQGLQAEGNRAGLELSQNRHYLPMASCFLPVVWHCVEQARAKLLKFQQLKLEGG